jgi:tRNA pseudouridine38-40 synthase
MPLYRLRLAYDGTDYHGWQIQIGARTVQETLESALARLAKHPVRVTGASRTDAGVHAHGQVAHFVLDQSIPPGGLVAGLNSILPRDIRVSEARFAPEGFDARRSARLKTYHYHLDTGSVPSPFRARYAHHHPHRLDREAMAAAAGLLAGTKDFSAFRAAACEAKTSVREVTVSRFFEDAGELVYEVSANGFLHHMVRNFVGTLLEVARGRLRPDDIHHFLEGKDRTRVGPTAPARGLHLMRVDYDEP